MSGHAGVIGAGARIGRRALLRGGLAVGALTVGGCAALPRSGPRTVDMTDTEGADSLAGLVREVDAPVVDALPRPSPVDAAAAFRDARPIDPERLGVGDEVDIVIWETDTPGLLGNATAGGATLASAPVDGAGTVFVPFAGPIRAAGATPAALRDRIRAALEPLTLAPEVDVRLREPRSRLVTVQGSVGAPGVYPIERGATRLTAMLALAGGSPLPPEQVTVTLRRGDKAARLPLDRVYADPSLDLALRPGDALILTALRSRFVVLGASAVQAELPFPRPDFDLLAALGVARGLDDFNADPSGVFLFRREDPALADALLPAPPPPGLPVGPGRPIVYRFDMGAPGAPFLARGFPMRDGDAIFVTNAPLTELRKFLQLFSLVGQPVQTVNSVGAL